MNKDVVYIEPEDDITDIIARIKTAKLKLVALVPPKKIGVLRSAVNTKLVAKAAKQAEKVVVIVTTDPALIKLAAAAQIPVAKNLQSRPKLPSEIIEKEKELGEQVINESDFDDAMDVAAGAAVGAAAGATVAKSDNASNANKANANNAKSANSKEKPADQVISSDDLEKNDKKGKKNDKGDKKGKIPVLEKYRKWIIIGAIVFVLLVGFLVWAFVFAPAAKISVAIRTTTNNFSENVSFVLKAGTEKPTEGVFLLEEQTVEKSKTIDFTATGQKDLGEKAKGTLNLQGIFSSSDDEDFSLPAGTTFSYGSNSYTTDSAVSFTNPDNCTKADYSGKKCIDAQKVTVTSTTSGPDANIGAHDSGWTSPDNKVNAFNAAAFTGGTSNVVTVVSQSDFDKAKEKLAAEGKDDGKSELEKKFGSDMITIPSSLEVTTSNPTASPGVDQEVKAGVTPKITATTTYKMYGVDKTKVEDFVKKKTEEKLASDQKIYAIDTPFFENFSKSDNNYTAKLKSSTKSGPKVSEEDILEKSKGKKVGEVQSLLKSINGVSSVSVKTSFPWVGSVPNDPNKVTVELKVEE